MYIIIHFLVLEEVNIVLLMSGTDRFCCQCTCTSVLYIFTQEGGQSVQIVKYCI